MRYIKIILRSLLTMSLLMIAAPSASAGTTAWEACTEVGAEKGAFEDNKCSKELAAGAFEWLELLEAKAATSSGTLKFRDTKGGEKKEGAEVECHITDEGTIGSGSKDEVTKLTINECKNIKGCPGTIKSEAKDLPWKTELVEEAGVQKDTLRTSGSGAPGWKVTCGIVADECTGETTDAFIENVSNGTVNAMFKKAESGKETCSVGGKEAGEIEGTDTIKAAVPIQTREVEFVWKVHLTGLLGAWLLRSGQHKTLKTMEAHNTPLKLQGTEGGKTFAIECPEIVIEGEIKGGRAGTNKETLSLKKCLNVGTPQCTIANNLTVSSNNLSSEIVAGVNGPNGNSLRKDLLLLLPEKAGESFFQAFAVTGTGCTTVTVKGNVLMEVRNAAVLVKVLKIKGEPLEPAAYRNSSGVEHTAGLTNAKLLGETEFKLEGEAEFGAY